MTQAWLETYLPHPIDWLKTHRVLVIKLRHHGDVLLSSPVFQVLKNHYPHLEIDALVYQDTAPMLEQHPAVSQLHVIDKKWKSQGFLSTVRHELSLIQQLRQRNYDVVIHLTESRRGLWLKWLCNASYGIAGNYSNRQDRLWKRAFPLRYPLPRQGNRRHTVEVHLDSLRKSGIVVQPTEKSLVLNLINTDFQKLEHQAPTLPSEPFIVLHPTSRWLFKTWPLDHYRLLIERLLEAGHNIVISAAPDPVELDLVNHMLDGLTHPRLIRLDGQLSLRTLAALISRATLMVGVDSVPMHIAAAVNTPLVALFGPSGDNEWGPWNQQAHVLTSQHTCRPCGFDGCGSGKVSECLVSITVDTVYQAIERQLNKHD